MSNLPVWLNQFLDKFASKEMQKTAIDKLPEDELNGIVPGMNSEEPPPEPGPDPMAEVPLPSPEPDVMNNVFEVNINGITFPVKLIPELVMKDNGAEGPAQPPGPPQDPLTDTSLNPNADPAALAQWLADPSTEKSFGNQEKGTVDPISQQEEGIAVHDTGNEKELGQNPKVPVHKKPKRTAAQGDPDAGADRSNPYYPCAVCANYDAKNGSCAQGLDVEKVQAAKSCSWLNSNLEPFKVDDGTSEEHKDEEIYKNDISQLPGGTPGSTQTGG